jgi:hypothetical protein
MPVAEGRMQGPAEGVEAGKPGLPMELFVDGHNWGR